MKKSLLSPSAEATEPRRRREGRRYHWYAYLYIVPALIFYVAFLIKPVLDAAWISLFDWDGINASEWIGLANYTDALTDPLIWDALSHSLIFIVFYALIPTALALVVIGVISRFKVRGLIFFRAVLFVPYILSAVVVAISWRWIFAESGPVNSALRLVGLDFVARAWLGDFDTALPSVGIIGTWVMFGLAFVLFLSGLQKIPLELFEAARLDGAGPVREFFAVTLPSLRGEIQVALILMITAALRNFDIVWNTTSGGPGTSTTVPSYYVYREAFVSSDVGRASAIAILLTVVIFAVVAVVMWLTRDRVGVVLKQVQRNEARRGGQP